MTDFQNADLEWDEHGQPLSSAFGDVYFSRASGLDETRHVFLQHNALAERFAALPEGAQLCIGETGFGTGLNFLCAWQLFERTAPASARLHFVSVERYPLTAADLRRALALWPELAIFSEQLQAQYVALNPGFQRLLFAGGRVVLTLLVGDVLERLPELDARIDAWFLDGFSPAKNPQMWSPELFAELARLSAPQATLATFTSAGFVRRGLIEAGFSVQRVPGFGHKREMLAGPFQGATANAPAPAWFARPAAPTQRRALILGGGLAGCSAAASLAQRGWQVELVERRAALAEETSGNPQGVLYMKLSAHHTALSRYIVAGFGHTRRLLQKLPEQAWQNCGVLQLAFDDKERERQAKLPGAFPPDLLHAVEREQAEKLAGIALPSGGLFYPQAGWAHPPALCRALADHPGIHLRLNQPVTAIRRDGEQWQLWADEQLLTSAPVLILAGSAEVNALLGDNALPLKRIRGQITRLPATGASRALKSVLCAEGYVAPAMAEEHTLGASFRFDAPHLEPSAEEHADNLRLLKDIAPALADSLGVHQLDPATLEGRAGFRCTSPDYLPIVGPLADQAAFAERYQVLARDARLLPQAPCPWLDGLYVSTAHGSRGLLSAPLAGELLASWLNDEPLPLPRDVAQACHPNRFALRRLIRGQS